MRSTSRLGPALVVGDGDLAGSASHFVRGRDVQDAIGVKAMKVTRSSTPAGPAGMPLSSSAQQVVVLQSWLLSPSHGLDQHARLVVRVGGEDLRLLRGDGGVALDQGRSSRSPAALSSPSDRGATSSSSRSCTPDLSPIRMGRPAPPACHRLARG